MHIYHMKPKCRCIPCCPAPEPFPVSFTAFKRDRVTGAPLAGAVFGLYQEGQLLQQATSDEQGRVTFTQLKQGFYALQELQAPDGYQAAPDTRVVAVDSAGQVTIDHVPAEKYPLDNVPLSSLAFFKTANAASTPLPGAQFRLSDGRTAVSGTDGRVDFGTLAPGSYTMQETTPPPGYQPNPHVYQIEVRPTGEITVDGVALNLFYVDNVALANFTFLKRDAVTGTPLAGAEFRLSNGDLAVSSTDGAVAFGALAAGSYTMQEAAPPAGYLPNSRIYQVTVSAAGSITVDGIALDAFQAENLPYQALAFRKRDAVTGQLLTGAQFRLSNGAAATSDSGGLVDFGALAPGNYTMEEVAAPPGYLVSEHVYRVEAGADGSITVDSTPLYAFSALNSPYPTFAFFKYDATNGAPLAGAQFRLSNGGSAISDAEGFVTFGSLAPGTYTLEETAAPEGYDRPGTTYAVAVRTDGTITVDGLPLAAFAVSNTRTLPVSPPPDIQPVFENDIAVVGTGIPGGSITVTFPDGVTSTTTVMDTGLWVATIPTQVDYGDRITAVQTLTGMLPSQEVTVYVQRGG